jgi:hypothetical protein
MNGAFAPKERREQLGTSFVYLMLTGVAFYVP